MMLGIRQTQREAADQTPTRWVLAFLGLLLFVHLVLLGFFQVSSLDTWFHLKEGELYVTTRSLPAQDPFAFTTDGREWIKYSWLADVLFYLVYAASGFPGLVLLRLGLLFGIAWLLYHLLRQCGLHQVAAVLLVFVASLAIRFRLFIRPEVLTYLLLLLMLAILFRLRTSPAWMSYTLIPLFVAWVNIHGSYVFGLGIPCLVLLGGLISGTHAAPGWDRLRLDPMRRRHLAMAVASLPFAGLLNPQGIGLLLFPFRQNRMIRLTAFPEWMEAWRYPGIDPVWWEPVIILGVVLFMFCAIAVILWIWERRFDPVGCGIVLSIGVYAVFRNRAIPYFVLAALPFLAQSILRLAAYLPSRAPAWAPSRLVQGGVLTCTVLLSLSLVDQAWFTKRFPPGFGVAANAFPEAAAAFMERYHLDGRVFNSYKFGGYLMWRRWPANQLFIDGRYDAILFDEQLLEEYFNAHRSSDALAELAGRYGIEILIVDAEPDRRIAHLNGSQVWARVYWDPVAEIYLRRDGKFARLIAEREYRLTGSTPDIGYLSAYRRDAQSRVRAIAELRRATEDNPENEIAWQALAQEYAAIGGEAAGARLHALERVLKLLAGNPAAGRFHAERAEALLQLGRPTEAEAAAREALRVDGSLLLPRWVLAGVAEGRGAWEEADEQLRTLTDLIDANHPMLPRVRERLDSLERRLQAQGAK
jgi:tetratricopeptide (TPR) repeat protein